jgi:hypothetical protein
MNSTSLQDDRPSDGAKVLTEAGWNGSISEIKRALWAKFRMHLCYFKNHVVWKIFFSMGYQTHKTWLSKWGKTLREQPITPLKYANTRITS